MGRDIKATEELSVQELKAYLQEHVHYELERLCIAAAHLECGVEDLNLRNALIESFGMHLRCLLDFLFPPWKVVPTDVLAKFFVTKPKDWEFGGRQMPPLLEWARNRVNKELGHLTTGRIFGTPPEKAWDVHGIMVAFVPIMKEFITDCSPGMSSSINVGLMRKWE